MSRPSRPAASGVRLAAMAAGALALAGCASFSADGGFTSVSRMTRERTGQAVSYPRTPEEGDAARARIAELLRQPLSPDGAVEVALLGNRGLQAAFADLGIAEADLVRAGRLRNPAFGFTRLSGGGAGEIDRSVMVDVLGLLTMPLAREVAQGRFEQAQLQAAADAVALATATRLAYFDAVASGQLLTYFGQVKDAADASSELAQRMLQAGNFNTLARMREQAFSAEAAVQLARARHQAVVDRERLTRLLGAPAEYTLPERLPELPPQPVEPRDAEQTAMDERLDVAMAKRSAEATARALGLAQATRFVNVLDAGYANKSQSGEARQNGYTIELELPLFDFGSARSARAEATYRQAVDRAAATALAARSEVRESWSAYRTAYQVARRYRDEIVPLHQRISEENRLRYNAMLISVFELLADAKDQVTSVAASVEALRDHWLAVTALQSAMAIGPAPTPSAATHESTP